MPILIVLVVFLFLLLAIAAFQNDDYEQSYCQDDMPCQECGRCYRDHPGSAFSSHSYVYPKDDLR